MGDREEVHGQLRPHRLVRAQPAAELLEDRQDVEPPPVPRGVGRADGVLAVLVAAPVVVGEPAAVGQVVEVEEHVLALGDVLAQAHAVLAHDRGAVGLVADEAAARPQDGPQRVPPVEDPHRPGAEVARAVPEGPHAHGGAVAPGRPQEPQEGLDEVGGHQVVGVDEHEAAPARGPDAGVAGRRDPPVVLAQVADAGVGQRAGPHDPAGRVGRAVVDDDDLDGALGLGGEAVQALVDVRLGVVDGHDDARPRPGGGGAGGARHDPPPRRARAR